MTSLIKMLTDRSDARRVAVLRQKTLARFKATDPTLFAGGPESVRVESVQKCCAPPISAIVCSADLCPGPPPFTVVDLANITPELVSLPSPGYFWRLATGDYYVDAPPCSVGIEVYGQVLPEGMYYSTINNEVTQDAGVFIATPDIGAITFPVTITVSILKFSIFDSPPPCGGESGGSVGPITFTLDAPS